MNLRDLMQLTGSRIEIWATTDGNWGAGFVDSRVRLSENIVSSCSGFGSSFHQALDSLAQHVAGKNLEINGKSYSVPPTLVAT